jgi:small-conductance mechanosensitive channel
LLANYIIIKQLSFSVRGQRILEVAFTLVSVYFLVRAFNHLLHYSIQLYLIKREETVTRIKQFDGMLMVVKALVWVIGLLFFLDNIGYSVTTIIAGLGIGGIAIALAAQNILSDLFSYFVIFLDKPFEIGDFIVVNDKSGSVEQIGFKTSRIRSLGGEELIIPNAELVKSTINNFKRLEKRRISFTVRVVYDTPPELLQEVPEVLKAAVEKREKTLLDRAHLATLADYYINFEVVYFVLSDDYNLYMNIQQAILLDIITAFRARGIKFALPTQVNLNAKNEAEIKQTIESDVDSKN